MEIEFDFSISQDDFNELNEQFSTINFVENKTGEYNQVSFNSKDLTTLEFDDFIKNWLDMGYSLEYGGTIGHYIITD